MVSGKTFGCPKNIWYIHNTGWVHIEGYPLTGLQRGDLPRAVSGGAALAAILSLLRPLSGRVLFTPSRVEISWTLSFFISIHHLSSPGILNSRPFLPRNTTQDLREILRSRNPGSLPWTRVVNNLYILRQVESSLCALISTKEHRLACLTRRLGEHENPGICRMVFKTLFRYQVLYFYWGFGSLINSIFSHPNA